MKEREWGGQTMIELQGLSDAELLAAYQRSSGEEGDKASDALAAEIERRGLDI
jgi:hypothetical protein